MRIDSMITAMNFRATKKIYAQLSLAVVALLAELTAASASAASFRAGASATDITPTNFPVIVNGGFLSKSADRAPAAPKFYAFCVEEGVKGRQPRPLPELARLLRELGYDGVGNRLWLGADLDENLRTLDQAGLQPYLLWTSLNVNSAKGAAYDPQVPAAIRKLAGRPTTVCVLLNGLKPGDPGGVAPAVKALREMGEVAAEAGVRISIYNHVNNWTERLPFILEVVKQVNHPRVGFNFNVSHWLKTDGADDYRPLLRAHADKLFCVTLSGAKVGATTWTDGLIQPLDRGDFDLRALVTVLGEIGYRGPFGLMCFGVPDDPREHLTRSLNVWRQLQSSIPPAR